MCCHLAKFAASLKRLRGDSYKQREGQVVDLEVSGSYAVPYRTLGQRT